MTCSDPSSGISYHTAAATGAPVFNVSCFADPGDQQLGNSPRYSSKLRTDPIRNMDAAMRKEFVLREAANESVRLQLRFETFNVFNNTRFGLPNVAYGDPLFGNVATLAAGFSPCRYRWSRGLNSEFRWPN